MWYRISWCNWKCCRFFILIEHHSTNFYKYAIKAERLIFKKFKIDPLGFESRYTVFDFQFFINNLIEEINEEEKEKERNSENKLIKVLRILKNMLNKIEL